MSHEIRTPIGAILSFSSLLREQLEGKIGDDLKDGFGILHRAGMRVMRTVDLILNMSEMQAGTYDYQPKVIDLNEDILENIEFEKIDTLLEEMNEFGKCIQTNKKPETSGKEAVEALRIVSKLL